MKTLKALKITGIIQGVYLSYCFITFIMIILGDMLNSPVLLQLGTKLIFPFFATIEMFACFIPICFFINLGFYLDDRKNAEQKALIGKKWVWIIVSPCLALILFALTTLPFLRVPIF